MAYSEANRTSVWIGEESTWGTIQSPNPMQEVRINSESLNYDISTVLSNELRSDRKVSETVQVQASVSGAVQSELSYGNSDTLMAHALASDWTSARAITGDGDEIALKAYSVGVTDSNYISLTTPITPAHYPAGMWLRVSGSVYNDSEFYAQVSSVNVAGTKIYLSQSGYQIANDEGGAGTGGTYYIDNDGFLRDGTTKKSLVLEKRFEDISQFFSYTGVRVGTMSANLAAGQILNLDFNFMGAASTRAAATVSTADTDAGTNEVMNATSNVTSIKEDGSTSTNSYQSIAFTVENGLRLQPKVGSKGPGGIGYGRCLVSLNEVLYFENGTLYDKFINDTSFSQSVLVKDDAGNAYMITFPHLEIQSSNVVAGGIDTDVLLNITASATYDSTTACQIQIDRFDKLA